MIIPLSIALIAPDPVEIALNRHVRYQRSATSQAATIQYKFFPGSATASGRILLKKPNMVRFEIKIAGQSFVFISGTQAAIEYLAPDRSYIEFSGANRWFPPPGELLDTGLLFPTPMIEADIQKWSKSWKLDGPQTAGITTIAATVQTQNGSLKYIVGIDNQGRIARYTLSTTDGSRGVTQLLTHQSNPNLAANLFNAIPPLGYTSAQLPYGTQPLARESLFPMQGWTSSNGETVQLAQWASNKTTLVAFVDPKCPRSRELISTLAKHRRTLEKQGLRLAGVDVRSQPNWITGIPTLKASQQTLSAMKLDGTPYLYMVASDGKIWGMWQGFDAEKSSAFLKEIGVALKEKGGY